MALPCETPVAGLNNRRLKTSFALYRARARLHIASRIDTACWLKKYLRADKTVMNKYFRAPWSLDFRAKTGIEIVDYHEKTVFIFPYYVAPHHDFFFRSKGCLVLYVKLNNLKVSGVPMQSRWIDVMTHRRRQWTLNLSLTQRRAMSVVCFDIENPSCTDLT